MSSNAAPAQRAGKLVSTDSTGRLPNNIITKAPDTAKLGGIGPQGYLRDLPGAVTGEHVEDGSLQREDLSPDLAVPRAFGLVNHAGHIEPTKPHFGLTNANVTSPAGTDGVYCISGLPFNPTTVSVSGSLFFSGPVLVFSTIPHGGGCEGVEGTQITVRTLSPQTFSGHDGSFDIQIWGW